MARLHSDSSDSECISHSAGDQTAAEVCEDIWNYMRYALQILTPDLEAKIETVTVQWNGKVKAFHTLPLPAYRHLRSEMSNEFPVGKKLGGIVLDITVNHQNWKNKQYLYACIVSKETRAELHHSISFRASMEMLLFMCVTVACSDKHLQQLCGEVFGASFCSCTLMWRLHKYDIDMEGCILKIMPC